MSGLRPSSVCDTTPLQRLESLSSSSEPSSPSPTLNGLCIGDRAGGETPTTSPATSTNTTATNSSILPTSPSTPSSIGSRANNTTLSLANHNNNKIEVRLNHFVGGPMKMDHYGTRAICCRVLLDALILICVGLPVLGFHMWGEAYRRGFFCDDESLKHPYRESTVHNWMLYLMGLALPVSIIITVEFFKSNSNRMRGIGNLSASRYYFWHFEIPDWIAEAYKKIGVLIFGAGIGQLTTDIAKYSAGRLRPHFFAVCQPILYDGSTCDDPINAGRYIEDFECQGIGMTPRMLKEVRLSFPSGHANFSFYTMIYIAVYLQKRMTWQRSKMFKHLLQFLFLMFAWYTALTRVSDYKHHWTDVLAGSAIGSLYAVVVTSSIW